MFPGSSASARLCAELQSTELLTTELFTPLALRSCPHYPVTVEQSMCLRSVNSPLSSVTCPYPYDQWRVNTRDVVKLFIRVRSVNCLCPSDQFTVYTLTLIRKMYSQFDIPETRILSALTKQHCLTYEFISDSTSFLEVVVTRDQDAVDKRHQRRLVSHQFCRP